jgi:hypothetical protein
MQATATKRDVLTFDSGAVYMIALKYQMGKQVSNGRIMFSTVDGEVFFMDPDDADKIYDLKLQPQEKFRLIRRGNSRTGAIEVSRITPVEQPVVRPAAPVAVMPAYVPETENKQQQVPQQPQNNSLSGIMASSYIAAIDALMIAQSYAESKGLPFRLSMGEVRSAAHCIFIQAGRLQERKSWQQ